MVLTSTEFPKSVVLLARDGGSGTGCHTSHRPSAAANTVASTPIRSPRPVIFQPGRH